jgi:hypothetical protein
MDGLGGYGSGGDGSVGDKSVGDGSVGDKSVRNGSVGERSVVKKVAADPPFNWFILQIVVRFYVRESLLRYANKTKRNH